MTTEPLQLPELALTEEEIERVYRGCDGRTLLVGGQSLAFWAQYYRITPVGVLSAHITRDADFIGTAQDASRVAEAMKEFGWTLWKPTMDDATPQTAKLSKTVAGHGIKQVDFLSSIVGLDTESIRKRAVRFVRASGAHLNVLHPLDVLASRLKNLAHLPSKRHPQGIAQAALGIEVVRAFIQQQAGEASQRELLGAIERVIRIAQDKDLDGVFYEHAFDLLAVVPVKHVTAEEFRAKRWPQVMAAVAEQRARYAKRRKSRSRRVMDER